MRSCFYRINKNILGYFHNFLVSRYSIRRPIYNTDRFLKLILTFTEAKYRKTSSESIRLKRFIFFFGDTFILMFGEFVCFCNIDFLEYEKKNWISIPYLTCWTVGVVASLIMMGAPPAGVVANGESNGEPELLEWLSADCWWQEKKKNDITINLIKSIQKRIWNLMRDKGVANCLKWREQNHSFFAVVAVVVVHI